MMRSLATAALLSATLVSAASAQGETWVAVASDGAGLWGAAVGMATREAAIISYSNDYLLMCTVTLFAVPLVLLLRKAATVSPAGSSQAASAAAAPAAMD